MDDVLRVFYGGSASEKTLVPTLKHPRQKNITCVKWRPLSASGLAVAAQDGVVLWKVKTERPAMIRRNSRNFDTSCPTSFILYPLFSSDSHLHVTFRR